jgi:hypothetical protein
MSAAPLACDFASDPIPALVASLKDALADDCTRGVRRMWLQMNMLL